MAEENAMIDFLKNKEPTEHSRLKNAIGNQWKISIKYTEYENSLINICNKKDANQNYVYPTLKKLQPKYDANARSTYATFLRLTRNSTNHPNDLKFNRLDCLMIFITFSDFPHRK